MSEYPEGFEGYPYASPEAERRIRLVTTLMSVVACGMLVVGLYLALLTPNIGLGSVLTLVGFVDLVMVPFIGKRMRATALAAERGEGTAGG